MAWFSASVVQRLWRKSRRTRRLRDCYADAKIRSGCYVRAGCRRVDDVELVDGGHGALDRVRGAVGGHDHVRRSGGFIDRPAAGGGGAGAYAAIVHPRRFVRRQGIAGRCVGARWRGARHPRNRAGGLSQCRADAAVVDAELWIAVASAGRDREGRIRSRVERAHRRQRHHRGRHLRSCAGRHAARQRDHQSLRRQLCARCRADAVPARHLVAVCLRRKCRRHSGSEQYLRCRARGGQISVLRRAGYA